MKKNRLLGLILTVVFLGVFAGDVFAWKGQVLKISDGDTITVRDERGKKVRVRFYAIDAPELKQDYGQDAKQELLTYIRKGAVVEIDERDRDRYGRVVAVVVLPDGRNLNQELLRDGAAWYYGRYCKDDDCLAWRKDEQSARARRVGLWKEANPVPPWEWRKAKRR